MEEQKRQQEKTDKTDKELREQNFTKTRVSKAHLKLFTEYCKEQRISKIDALHELITFLHETNMPVSALKVQNVTRLVQDYHNYTAGILKNFEHNFLSKLDKIHRDNIDFLTKTLNLTTQSKGRDRAIQIQSFKLLRVLVQESVDDAEATSLLKETLLAIQESESEPLKKETTKKETQTTKQPIKEIISLTGAVGNNPKIEQSVKGKKLYLLFTLAEKLINSREIIWHNVVMWEGELTQKLRLKDEQEIRNFFAEINTGDTIKLKGYITDATYKDKDGQNLIKKTFIVTEVISHVR